MKKYSKAKMVAKNLASGSYAAGCPGDRLNTAEMYCKKCEHAM